MPLRPETMKAMSSLLAALAIGAAVFLFWELFFCSSESDFRKILAENSKNSRIIKAGAAEEIGSAAGDISVFESRVSGRSLFQTSSGSSSQSFESGPAAVLGALEDISLVGILPGDTPQAILENRKTQKTFYLSVGQTEGEVTLDKIDGQSVRLSSGADQKTLVL